MTVSGSSVPARQTPAPSARTPSATRYWLAVLLAVVGAVAGVAFSLVAESASSAHAAGLVRTTVPGQVTVSVDRPGTFYVYAEGTLSAHPTVQVTGPDGRAVPVTEAAADPLLGGAPAPVGTFDARATGAYLVAMSTGSAAQGEFSVGGRYPLWIRLADTVAFGLLVAGVVAGVVLAVVTAVQRRRGRSDATARPVG